MKTGMRRRLLTLVGLACAMALSLVVGGRMALAASTPKVTGANFYYVNAAADAGTDAVDVLNVEGSLDQTIYFEVTKGDQVIASHLAYTPDGSNQTGQGDFAGVVTMDFAGGFDTSATYTIKAYADRAETQQIFSGTTSAVFAQVEGQEPFAIGVQTVADGGQSTFAAPDAVEQGGVQYALQGKDPASQSPLTYSYKAAEGSADATFTGTVTYVDQAGNTISQDTYEGIGADGRTVDVPNVVSKDGSTFYRTLAWGDQKVTFTAQGAHEVVVTCMQIDPKYAEGQNLHFYTAYINLVGSDGQVLGQDKLTVTGDTTYSRRSSSLAPFQDKLTVTGDTTYTVPQYLYRTVSGEGSSVVTSYQLASDQSDSHVQDGVISLKTDEKTNGDAVNVTVTYDKNDAGQVPWLVQCVYNDPNDTDASGAPKTLVLDSKTQLVDQTPGASATYTAQDKIERNGVTYVPADDMRDYSYTFGSGDDPVTTIYYVPEGQKAQTPNYTVTVKYVDYANPNALKEKPIKSVKINIQFSHGDYAIDSEAKFSQGGVTYVRLAGQEKPLRHTYYSRQRTYIVWCRNINDTSISHVTINRLLPIYREGQATNGTGNQTSANGQAGDQGQAANDQNAQGGQAGQNATTTTGLPTNQNLSTVGDGTTNTIVGDNGTDLNTERIEDNTTPLAAASGSTENSGLSQNQKLGIGIAAAAVAAALIAFLVIRKKKQATADASSDTKE